MSNTVLLTGASGFVGSAVRHRLLQSAACKLITVWRNLDLQQQQNELVIKISSLDINTDWHTALSNVDIVIHAAARVHVMNDKEADPLTEFRKINVEGTMRLARQAVEAGVKRFIFISSIKVNGEGTQVGNSYKADDLVAPVDPYGISKAEAEEQLLTLGKATGIEIVIIRPVLVYGPGVRANFLSMMRWLDRGIILPFGAIHNRRSLVAIDNLVDLIVTCVTHPNAANQRFLVSDDEDLSTTDLLRRMAKSLGKRAMLVSVPTMILSGFANTLGKKALSQRLLGSLTVDISKTKKMLDWTPPVTVDEALSRTAQNYKSTKTK